MGRQRQVKRPFMRSLLHDRTANTLAIAAASMVPLMAMVGGGIDASRYYMTASRMQAACDAGALAARRAMMDDTFTSAHRTIGLTFYDQNFENGMFGVEGATRDFTSDGEGVVTGTASATLPTTIMGAFGFDGFNVEVSCSAEVNISNTDIMFVLDVTGSMAECPNGTNCSAGPGSKIVALRDAVMNFYDTVEAATSDSAQVRYGFVPYDQNVNVGFSIPRQYMANDHTYQSRVARFREQFTFVPGNGVRIGDPILVSDQTEWLPRSTTNFGASGTDPYRFRTTTTADLNASQNFCFNTLPGTYTVNGQTWTVFAPTEFRQNQWPSGGGNSTNRAGCRGRVRKTRPAVQSDIIPDQNVRSVVFQDWVYCPVDTTDPTPCDVNNPVGSPPGWESIDLATLYDDNQIMLPIGSNGAMLNQSWPGCIEEAATVVTGSYDPRPSGAYDLDINLIPNSEATKWKPMLPNIIRRRSDSGGNTRNWVISTNNNLGGTTLTCPRAARKLAEISRTDLQTYVNGLNPGGNTYHDIGMTWGARFISPRGIFRAENEAAPNGDAISRHIVFMTDGLLVTNNQNYSPHGVEFWDRRITSDGSNAQETARRAARLQAVCKAAKQENITVWVVAFGVNLTQNLIDCASPGRAFQANDSATLNAQFQEIAQKIAALRLTS